ncbi:MAG: DUF1402 family protein [bacterium]|nr:DUF1402 family protein [bacterium]
MKFILVVTNARGKNLAFVSRELQTLSLREATEAVRRGDVAGAYVVERKTGAYIRSKKSVPKFEQFEKLSISSKRLFSYTNDARHAVSTPALSRYVELYLESVRDGQDFIVPIDQPKVLSAAVKEKLIPQQAIIFAAAKTFEVDPYLLGAILIDEIARLKPFEEITDALGPYVLGTDTTIGIAQVRISTANNLIKKGAYNPNPEDTKLPFKKLDHFGYIYIFNYLIQPKHNIPFAVAFIRSLINEWRKEIDLAKKPEIIATLYHRGYVAPHSNPAPDERGSQIAGEFYALAKRWLQEL